MRNVFLTGCTGEIGSRLTINLLKLGYQVFGIRRTANCGIRHSKHTCRRINLLDPTSPIRLKETSSRTLIHTAWITDRKEFWNSTLNSNWVTASKRLVNEFVTQGGEYVLVTGSCAEYSWDLSEPLNEYSLEKPLTNYGKAKLEFLNWLRKEEIEFLWTRTFFQFGMNEPTGRLIPAMIDHFSNKRNFVVHGSSDIRDFVFVEDVAEVLAVLLSQESKGIVNIGTGLETEVSAVSELIARKIGVPELLHFEPRSSNKSYVVSDATKLEALIGNLSWTPLEAALEKTIAARKQHIAIL